MMLVVASACGSSGPASVDAESSSTNDDDDGSDNHDDDDPPATSAAETSGGEDPPQTDGPATSSTSGPSGTTEGPPAVCGDALVEGDEACDDGNDLADDGCERDCTPTGDTLLWSHLVPDEAWIGRGVAVDEDGDVAIVGNWDSSTWLARRLSSDGDLLWSIPYATGDDDSNEGEEIVFDGNGNTVAVGTSELAPNVAKFDPAGAQLWSSSIYDFAKGWGSDLSDVAIAPDGDVLVAGAGYNHAWFGRLTAGGTAMWTVSLDDDTDGYHERSAGIDVDGAGNIYLGVERWIWPDKAAEPRVYKFRADGSLEWTAGVDFPDPGPGWARDVVLVGDDTLAIGGERDDKAGLDRVWFARLDLDSGDTLHYEAFSTGGDIAVNALATDGDALVAAGSTHAWFPDGDDMDLRHAAWVRRWDADGGVAWTQYVHDLDGAERAEAHGVAIGPDGGVHVAGQIVPVPNTSGTAWAAKFAAH